MYCFADQYRELCVFVKLILTIQDLFYEKKIYGIKCNLSSPLWNGCCRSWFIKESSFNMTRGGNEDIEGGALKIIRHPKGGL